MRMELAFHPVRTEEEIGTLARLASEIWNEYFVEIISVEQIDYMVDKFQSYPALTELIGRQGYEYYFMNDGGENVGYIGIKAEASKLFLSKFYIRKEHRGRGFASQALAFLEGVCRERGLGAVWLTVNRHNDSTIAIYKKKGFEVVREQAADIGNGFVMDDFVMEKAIPAR